MRPVPRMSRVSLVLAVAAAPLVTLAPVAQAAPVDCSYTKSKKLVTITIDNTASTGWLTIERQVGTNKIGYTAEGEEWKGCEGARTGDTDKVKVVGSTLSEKISINLENGAFAPGASQESNGVSEIEFDLDLGNGTDTVALVGGNGNDRLAFPKATQGMLNGDTDVDVTMTGVDRWELSGNGGTDLLDGRGVPTARIWVAPALTVSLVVRAMTTCTATTTASWAATTYWSAVPVRTISTDTWAMTTSTGATATTASTATRARTSCWAVPATTASAPLAARTAPTGTTAGLGTTTSGTGRGLRISR